MSLTTRLYPGAQVHGPYFDKSEQRWFVTVRLPDNTKITLKYARFKMQEYLERLLTTDEEVDHMDEDRLNDNIENLQILTKLENVQKSFSKYQESSKEQCFWCDSWVILMPKQRVQRDRDYRRNSVGPFCSKKCSGQFAMSQRV